MRFALFITLALCLSAGLASERFLSNEPLLSVWVNLDLGNLPIDCISVLDFVKLNLDLIDTCSLDLSVKITVEKIEVQDVLQGVTGLLNNLLAKNYKIVYKVEGLVGKVITVLATQNLLGLLGNAITINDCNC